MMRAGSFDFFRGQAFGPRKGFVPRDWQAQASDAYIAHLEDFLAAGEYGPDGRRDRPLSQHRFIIHAGTGSGKTKAAGLIASRLLNDRMIGNVVYVCPNTSIKEATRADLVEYFGIDLVSAGDDFVGKFSRGIPPGLHGYITTYQGILEHPEGHRNICSYFPTLVVLDEIHHLGDHPERQWTEKAKVAFGDMPYLLGLTGSPYRSDNYLIYLLEYEEVPNVEGVRRFKANFTYTLGRAIQDQVCRMPQFIWHDGKVMLRPPGRKGVITVSFDDTDLSEKWARDRLRGAVSWPSETRRQMLADALGTCRDDGRICVIFLGGDTQADIKPTYDALHRLPAELAALGISRDEYVILVSSKGHRKRSLDDLERLRRGNWGKVWIVVSVNMFAEGTDLPDVSAGIFLTTVTTKQNLIQRVGRVMRWHDGKFPTCLLFMFPDPRNVAVADEIQGEIHVDQPVREAKPRTSTDDEPPAPRTRTEAYGVEGGHMREVQVGSYRFPVAQFEALRAEMRRKRMPAGWAEAAMVLMAKMGEICDVDGTID